MTHFACLPLPSPAACTIAAMGMQSGAIQNCQLSSSPHNINGQGPTNARLNSAGPGEI